jgi:hypothetical protein
MARPLRTTTLRRLRALTAVTAALVASSACGLQRAGVDGIVTAEGAPVQGASVAGGVDTPGAPDAASGGPGGVAGGEPGADAQAGSGGTSSGVVGGSGVVSSGGVSGGSAGSGSTATGSTGTSGSAAGVVPPQTPGLKGELAVTYINVSGFDQLGKVVVIRTASTGDARAQANAIAAHVNANGGIAGRKLVVKVRDYNAQQASEVNDNNLCQQITQTDKAFMAVLHGQIHASARDCYAARKTIAFEGAAYGWGKGFYDEHNPYLWSPSYADYDQTSRALVTRIKESKWLAGESKVGVILWDDEAYHQVVDKSLAPGLKGLGVEVVKAAISNSDIGSIENGIHAAAQTMVASGVDHLTFVGSSPLQPFFVQQNQQNRQFVYALTSFDVPRYMAVEFSNNMVGMVGIGFSPVDDVLDAQHPFPQPGLEAECTAIYKKYGVDVPGRYVVGEYNSKQAMSYCESTLLLKKAADAVKGELTGAAWTAVANTLGTSFQAAQTFRTSYGPAKHTGSAVFRDITYDPSAQCKCMRYSSGNRPLS